MTEVFGIRRSRIAWIAVTGALGLVLATFLGAFVGTFVLGLFFYYAVRPIFREIHERVESRSISATLTLLFVVIPGIALVAWVGLIGFREFTQFAGPGLTAAVESYLPTDPQALVTAIEHPEEFVRHLEGVQGFGDYLLTGLGAIGTVSNGMLHLTLASAFAFFLLRDGHRLDDWFRETVGGVDSAAYVFLRTVDAELEQVYFGNVLTVAIVTLLAIVFYNVYNLLAPGTVQLPVPTLLAILTGIATFVPLVVGKIVYVPTAAYLFWEASQTPGTPYWAPVVFVVTAFLFLDLVPMTFLLPYISGRTLHTGLVMFSYVLGGAFFGWYGLFLGPLLAVVLVQFAKIILPEVIHGEPVDPDDRSPIDIGLEPKREPGLAEGTGDGGEGPPGEGSAGTGDPTATGDPASDSS